MSSKAAVSSDETLPAQISKKEFRCHFCCKVFRKLSALRPHIYTHTGEKPFSCDLPGCNKRFAVVSNLRRHFKVHYRKQGWPQGSGAQRAPEVVARKSDICKTILPAPSTINANMSPSQLMEAISTDYTPSFQPMWGVQTEGPLEQRLTLMCPDSSPNNQYLPVGSLQSGVAAQRHTPKQADDSTQIHRNYCPPLLGTTVRSVPPVSTITTADDRFPVLNCLAPETATASGCFLPYSALALYPQALMHTLTPIAAPASPYPSLVAGTLAWPTDELERKLAVW